MCECADCGASVPEASMASVGRNGAKDVCESCADEYSSCASCDTNTHSDDLTSVYGDDLVCERCRDRDFSYSEMMGEWIPDSEIVRFNDRDDCATRGYARAHCYWSPVDGEWYVDYENAPSEDDDEHLFDYGANVLEHCAFDSEALQAGALMFGVELEMEPTRGNCGLDVAEALGGRQTDKFILKSDGSLSDGVELVTVPLTLDQHRASFDWPGTLAPVARKAKSGSGTNACGMHVHINKRALSALQIGKMLVFCNSTRTRVQLETIAQRGSNSYCERSEKKLADGKKYSESRYDILNVGGRGTVEVRMFRGNLRPERVLKNIEFCHALVTYCADCSIADIESWDKFADWLLKRRGQYPELVKFLDGAAMPRFAGIVKPRKDQPAIENQEI